MSELLDRILSRNNMNLAYKRVKANKGAGGIDEVEVDENCTATSKRTGRASRNRSGRGHTSLSRSEE
jgi:hypothetical protein